MSRLGSVQYLPSGVCPPDEIKNFAGFGWLLRVYPLHHGLEDEEDGESAHPAPI